jgi:hypothetical protein
MQAIRDHVEQPEGGQAGVVLSARHFQQALEAVTKASQYARAQRLLRDLPLLERVTGEQQQTRVEEKPVPHRTAGIG